MPAPKKPYQPRMTDPVSGRKLQKGRAVPGANAPPAVTDPYTGSPLQKGRPVPAAYSGAPNQRVGQAISSGIGAIQAAFKPPYLGAKGRVPDQAGPPAPRPRSSPRAQAAAAVPPPPSAPSSPARRPAAYGQAAAMPASRLAPAPNSDTLDSVSRRMPNSRGYEDFPPSLGAPKKRKKNGT